MTFSFWILHLMTISLVIAYDDLSYQKPATQSSTYFWPYDLYKADNAVDRNITTCMRTDPIGSNSPYKTVWWKVDLGGVYNIFSVNILFKNYDGEEMRQRGRLAGFSLYVSKTGEREEKYLCYKDGPQLPPLNFTTTCDLFGQFIIFYNERLPLVIYPSGYEVSSIVFMELCEVIVYGCYRDGVYGRSCDTPCPSNCKTNTCSLLNGKCSECKTGWMGTTCNLKCVYGWYGVDCKQPCPGHCRGNATCNHVTGLCDGGCAAGWNGSLCNKSCPSGYYGFYCTQLCSGNCRNNAPCNHVTGVCDAGCAAGWDGSRCDSECAECVNALPDMTSPATTNSSTAIFSDRGSGLCVQDYRYWNIVGPVSLGFNILFIIGLLVFFWSVYNKRISLSVQKPPCMKSNLYVETEVTTEDNSHYQELGLSRERNIYQNTIQQ